MNPHYYGPDYSSYNPKPQTPMHNRGCLKSGSNPKHRPFAERAQRRETRRARARNR
jgi:hypothetical protein